MIRETLERILRRKPDSHKGDYGHVLVLAGSRSYTGAPYFASQAALLSGAGLVTLGIPKSLHPILAAKLTEVMVRPFPETREATFSLAAEKEILSFSEKIDVVALGPGISLNPQTQRLARGLLAKLGKPLVIDADGIAALRGHLHMLKKIRTPVVLTPHPGEFARLVGREVAEIQKGRKDIALRFSREYNVVLVLKGHGTVVANSTGKFYINKTGNPGMASGGAGDCLTGIIAGLMAQGLAPYEASALGAHVHGLAGDLAAKEKGLLSLIATDLLQKLPEAFRTLA
jgi:NAD(P)H-hydrate epimerase